MGEQVKQMIKDSKPVYVKYYGLCYQVDQNVFDRLRNMTNIDAIKWYVGRWGLEYLISQSDIEEKLLMSEVVE